jgi:hypothetical protein
MKTLLILFALVTAITADAADRRREAKEAKPDVLVSAVNYGRSFYTELSRAVALPRPFNTGGGGDTGNLHYREWTYRVPADQLPTQRVGDIAFRAHLNWNVGWTGWGGHDGGGGNRFSAHAGTTGACVFIDVIASTEGSDTVILVLARGTQ